jgi:hypothetical protein
MEEALDSSLEELKRVDHLIYVSLKYTRTCDIFKSIIERMIEALNFAFEALLIKLEEEHKIMEVPIQPGIKAELIKEHYPDEKMQEIVDFYLLLRKLNRADFTREREYRRHVTMRMEIDGSPFAVNIDSITEYLKKLKEEMHYIHSVVKEEPEA